VIGAYSGEVALVVPASAMKDGIRDVMSEI